MMLSLVAALLAPQDLSDLVKKYLEAGEKDRPAIAEKIAAAGTKALAVVDAAHKAEKKEENRRALRDLRARCLKDAVVAPHLKKEHPGLAAKDDPWKELVVTAPWSEALEKLAPEVTFFFVSRGLASPVGRSDWVKIVLAVSNDGKTVAELAYGYPGKKSVTSEREVVDFLNKFLGSGKDRAPAAAAVATLHAPCGWRFGHAWPSAGDFAADGAKMRLKKDSKPAKDGLSYAVEFEAGGAIRAVQMRCSENHPICFEHRAAAAGFMTVARPGLRVGDVIYTDPVRRAFPGHYLYEALDGGRVVGFVLVVRGVKRSVYVDRAILAPLLGYPRM